MIEIPIGTINKWIERIHGENDFSRSVAVSLCGIIRPIVYLV